MVPGNKRYVEYAIKYLDDNHVEPSNVVVQKLMLYLRYIGKVPISYKFEPLTHGPFSVELSDDLSEIRMHSDKINSEYCDKELDQAISDFLEVLKYDTTFDNVVAFSWVLYAYVALEKVKMSTCKENVLKEARAWANRKCNDELLPALYDSLVDKIACGSHV